MNPNTSYMAMESATINAAGGREPVGSTGGGRHAPTMQPDRDRVARSHFCDEVGSTVYCEREQCPHCGVEDGETDE